MREHGDEQRQGPALHDARLGIGVGGGKLAEEEGGLTLALGAGAGKQVDDRLQGQVWGRQAGGMCDRCGPIPCRSGDLVDVALDPSGGDLVGVAQDPRP